MWIKQSKLARGAILSSLVLTSLALCSAALPASAQAIDIQSGVICDLVPTGSAAAPDTESGIINLIDQERRIDMATQRVPARIGTHFGVRILLPPDAAPINAQVVVRHPAFQPSGVTVQRWQAWIEPGEPALNLFSFELPHELVTGEWVFQFHQTGEVFAQARFDVVPPAMAQDVIDFCEPANIPIS